MLPPRLLAWLDFILATSATVVDCRWPAVFLLIICSCGYGHGDRNATVAISAPAVVPVLFKGDDRCRVCVCCAPARSTGDVPRMQT